MNKTSNISLTKSSSFWQLKIPVPKSTPNEQQKHVNQVIALINKSTAHSSVNCSECDNSFSNTGSLAYHLWTVHCKEEQMYHSTQFTPNQSNSNQPAHQIFEFGKFQQNSSFTTTINNKGITTNMKIHLENQHQEKPMTSKNKVIKKSFYKCEWDFCERLFVGLEDLKTHVLNVHVDGFDEEDGEYSGEVSVETLKKDEQSIEQVNPINPDKSTLDDINENEQSISHDHESTNAKSSQQLLVDSESSKESIDEMVLEDDTDLDEQSMDYSYSTDSDEEQLHQSEHSPPELNKPTNESKSINQNETIFRPYRCFYCDDEFEMVDCLRKHFEAFHSRKAGEESESDDQSLGEMDSEMTDSELTDLDGTDSEEESLEETTSNEKTIHSQQFVTQQQTLSKSINEIDDQDGKIEVIDDSPKLHYATTDDNGPKESNINKHQQQQLVHQVTELNESTNQSSLNCPECGKSLDNKYSVKMHLKQVHPKQMLKCGVSGCGQSFKTIYQLLAHYRHKKAHKKVNLPCDQCTMFKNRNDFMEHLQAHHFIYFESQQPIHQNIKSTNQSLFICPKCGKSLCDKHTLYMHLLVVHPKQMYKCDVSGCGKWCKTINQMLTHYRNKKTHKTANLPCDQCKKFVINIDFRVHLETHHQIFFEPQQPTHQNIKSTNQSLFICPECGKSLCDTTTLNAHLKKVHPKQMFFCGVNGCGKWCKSISEMLSHYRHKKAHNKVNLPCDECKKFGKDRHLKAHLERDHSISFDLQQPGH